MKQERFYILVATDQDKGSETSKNSNREEEEKLLSAKVLVQRSARIQQAAQQPDTSIGKFVIVPPTLTLEQRREYV